MHFNCSSRMQAMLSRTGLLMLVVATYLFGWGGIAYAAIDKWHPGIYVKIEDWQLRSPAHMETIYEELRATPQLRGIKVVLFWGRYETRDKSTGSSTYDFTQIDGILAKLATLDNKHLILSVPWREFKSEQGDSDLLPDDLRGGRLWNSDPGWAHTQYTYLWAFQMGNRPGKYAYNMKLWNAGLLARLDGFLAALAAHIDSHPNFTQITTTESAIGDPVTSWEEEGGSAQAQYDGQLAVVRSMKRHFLQSLVVPELNFDRKHVARMVALLEQEGLGLGSPNSNLHPALTMMPQGKPPGVLTYYPGLSGRVLLAPEIQGDEYERTYGPGSAHDHPSYEHLYKRVRDDLKANYTVVQRNFPFWLGNASKGVPSMLTFLQTYPTIVNDRTGAGGLNHTQPRSLH